MRRSVFLPYVGTGLFSVGLALAGPSAFAAGGESAAREPLRLPTVFVPNAGQTDPAVRFQAVATGATLFFTPSQVVLALPQAAPASGPSGARDLGVGRNGPGNPDQGVPVRFLGLRFIGAAGSPEIEGVEPLPGIVSVFRGGDPARWRAGLPTYAAIAYRGIYPGIDLRYEGIDGAIKGTYRVEPGADPGRIRWSYSGAGPTRIDRDGNLLISAGSPRALLVEHAPAAWQELAGAHRPVRTRYAIGADGSIGFALPDGYDPSLPLILDPTLTYSTFLGGGGDDVGYGVAVDASGAMYVTGYTLSVDFPTKGAPDPGCGTDGNCDEFAFTDAFVAKLNPAVSGAASLVFSTYLGGSGDDAGVRVAVDGAGASYVTGLARAGFPTTANAFQQTFGGGGDNADAFVTKLSANGAQLLYSTYLGSSGGDGAWGLALDASANVYITGQTTSPGFPTTAGVFDTSCGTDGSCNGDTDAFVAKLNPAASGAASLVFSTFLGGAGTDQAFGIAVDAAGGVYVTGRTASTDFPTTGGAYQASNAGGYDAFVTKLSAGATALAYSSYFGGDDYDDGYSIALGGANRPYVVGTTFSSNLPTTAGALQSAFGGVDDAYLAKLDPAVSGAGSLVHSTYLGGNDDDQGYGLAVDGSDVAYVSGLARSTNLPMAGGPFQPANGGFWDAFVMKVNPALSGNATLLYSTYAGGPSTDAGFGLALDAARNIFLVGQTYSAGFPTVSPFQAAIGGGSDAWLARIDNASTAADLSVGQTDSPDPTTVGSNVTYAVTVTNGGPAAASGVRLSDVVLGNADFVSATPSQGTCTTVSFFGEQDVTCQLGTLASGASATLTVVVNSTSAGTLTSTARASSNVSDPDPSDNRDEEATTVVLSADLSITKTDGKTTATPGQPNTYTIVVSNSGPDSVFGATVTDTVPAAITGATWTCVASGGAACSASGSGSINDTVDLPMGDTVTYTLSGTIAGGASGTLANTASVAAPGGVVDPVPGNNSATDSDTLTGGCPPPRIAVPDGRLGAGSIAAGATAWFAASLRIGNSYSLELKNTTGAAVPPGTLTVFSGDDGCVTSTLTTRDIAAIDPAGTQGAARRSFTATGTATLFRARLVNGAGGAIPFSLSWSDTTMFSPAWSDTSGFDTFYSFQNTTGETLNATLTLRNGAGAVVKTLTVSIPALRSASTNTIALGIARNQTGSARLVHDGPPGGVIAEAAIARFSGASAFVQPVKFLAVREAK